MSEEEEDGEEEVVEWRRYRLRKLELERGREPERGGGGGKGGGGFERGPSKGNSSE